MWPTLQSAMFKVKYHCIIVPCNARCCINFLSTLAFHCECCLSVLVFELLFKCFKVLKWNIHLWCPLFKICDCGSGYTISTYLRERSIQFYAENWGAILVWLKQCSILWEALEGKKFCLIGMKSQNSLVCCYELNWICFALQNSVYSWLVAVTNFIKRRKGTSQEQQLKRRFKVEYELSLQQGKN